MVHGGVEEKTVLDIQPLGQESDINTRKVKIPASPKRLSARALAVLSTSFHFGLAKTFYYQLHTPASSGNGNAIFPGRFQDPSCRRKFIVKSIEEFLFLLSERFVPAPAFELFIHFEYYKQIRTYMLYWNHPYEELEIEISLDFGASFPSNEYHSIILRVYSH